MGEASVVNAPPVRGTDLEYSFGLLSQTREQLNDLSAKAHNVGLHQLSRKFSDLATAAERIETQLATIYEDLVKP